MNVGVDSFRLHCVLGAEGDDGDHVSTDDYSIRKGKFERWAVQCQKPHYQSPCTGFQKYECVFINDRWKMKKCRLAAADIPLKRKWCKCKALSKYRLSKLEPEERRMQRAFLKEHTSVNWRGYKPRFLKTVAGRSKRQAQTQQADSQTEQTGQSSSDVLRDVAEDELDEVELIMEDISEELSGLEVLFFYFFCCVFFMSFH